MSAIKRNRAGTAYKAKEDGTLLYQCQYCDTWFVPKTKFKQKYCSESCRVMASRERNHGLGGTLTKKRSAISNTDLFKQLQAIQSHNEQRISHIYDLLQNKQHEANMSLADEVVKLRGDMNRSMDYLMIMTVVAPLVSPAIANFLMQLITGEKPAIDQVKEELAGVKEEMKKVDKPTQLKIKKMLEEKELAHIAKKMGL